MSRFTVCALYKFVTLENYQDLRPVLQALMDTLHIRGTLLLAKEGINGTVAAEPQAIEALKAWFAADPRFDAIDYKESHSDTQPFYRSKVKLKKEIVTLGIDSIDPKTLVGTYVQPEEWNALIQDPDVILIDTRNDYEVNIGTFAGAVNPATESFREFPDYVAAHLNPQEHKKVAMFCTGGIRCEKSTAYLKQQGFEEVYHLKGGILNYLEKVPQDQSLWQGECFVFDNRVTVDHQLNPGHFVLCAACRQPLSEDDQQHIHYQEGLSCHHCYDKLTPEQQQRHAARQQQIELARQRGEAHLGAEAVEVAQWHKLQKQQRKNALRAQAAAKAGSASS